MTAGLTDFFKYNLWANLKLLETCEKLTEEQLDSQVIGTFGTIRETLMHLFSAEEDYAFNFTRNRPEPRLGEIDPFPGFAELRRRAELSGNDLIKIATEGDLNQTFLLDGGTYTSPAIIVLIQTIDHAIDHRSQISTMLSQLDIEPPVLDAWAYNNATLPGGTRRQ